MKKWGLSLGLGLVALVVQGALATLLPPPWCPDLGLLVVLCLGLRWRGLAAGLALAGVLGFSADWLSGSLVGQHGLLRVLAFASALIAGRQLNLRRGLPLVAFVFSATLIYGILAALISQFFLDVGWPPASVWLGGILHAAINGLCAPWAAAAVRLLGVWAGDEDGVSRALPIESARRPV